MRAAPMCAKASFAWPQVLDSAIDPGWARTKMGGPSAPVDVETGQRTQTWLAVSDDPDALVSGNCGSSSSCSKVFAPSPAR
jgi:hypothetical protein